MTFSVHLEVASKIHAGMRVGTGNQIEEWTQNGFHETSRKYKS